jgi:hypothetical protein
MFRPKPSLAFACPIPSWTIDRVFGPIRISNGNTLMCAAIVSFRSLIPRFVPAISGQQLTETYGDATRRFNRRKMFSAVFVSFEGGKPAIVRGKEPPTWSRIFTEWERKVEATFDGMADDLRSAASVFMTGTLARPGC